MWVSNACQSPETAQCKMNPENEMQSRHEEVTMKYSLLSETEKHFLHSFLI